ncbi:hypothetical protein ACVNIS_01050 [Sphaerotilaceae bacterium SBD11-9]
MPQPILLEAAGETSDALRELLAGKLPAGFDLAHDLDRTEGLNVDPLSVALVGAGGAVLASLISALAEVWKARVEARKKNAADKLAVLPTVTISTHADDIVIRLGPDATVAIAKAALPANASDVVEIRLGVVRV